MVCKLLGNVGRQYGWVALRVSLGKADEVLVVGVHVGELTVDQHHDLLLALLLLLPDVGRDDPLHLLSQPGVPRHLGTQVITTSPQRLK
jgi:hypothetical protein